MQLVRTPEQIAKSEIDSKVFQRIMVIAMEYDLKIGKDLHVDLATRTVNFSIRDELFVKVLAKRLDEALSDLGDAIE